MAGVGVLWDLEDDPDGNVRHVAENDLTVEEVEDVLLNPDNDVEVSRTSGRPITFGWTSTGRYVAVIWEMVIDEPATVRVRTAYEVRPKRGGGNMSERNRVFRKSERTPVETAELKAERERFSRERPGPDDLAASGDYDGPYRQADLMDLLSALAALKQERERRALSLAEVSERSGLDKGMISRLENGKILNPTMTTLWKYAGAVGMAFRLSAERVLAGTGDR